MGSKNSFGFIENYKKKLYLNIKYISKLKALISPIRTVRLKYLLTELIPIRVEIDLHRRFSKIPALLIMLFFYLTFKAFIIFRIIVQIIEFNRFKTIFFFPNFRINIFIT